MPFNWPGYVILEPLQVKSDVIHQVDLEFETTTISATNNVGCSPEDRATPSFYKHC